MRLEKIRLFNAVNLTMGYNRYKFIAHGRLQFMGITANFKAVEMTRQIRDEIYDQIQHMTTEQRSKYYQARLFHEQLMRDYSHLAIHKTLNKLNITVSN